MIDLPRGFYPDSCSGLLNKLILWAFGNPASTLKTDCIRFLEIFSPFRCDLTIQSRKSPQFIKNLTNFSSNWFNSLSNHSTLVSKTCSFLGLKILSFLGCYFDFLLFNRFCLLRLLVRGLIFLGFACLQSYFVRLSGFNYLKIIRYTSL